MRTSSTLIVFGLATVLNVGLWLWSRPIDSPRLESSNARAQQCDARFANPTSTQQSPATPIRKAETKKVDAVAAPPDQPWLSTVRDSVLQASLMPKFSDKVLLSGVECKGSQCEITGSTKPGSNGQWHGSSDVADFMQAMGDGQIAGGDTNRLVALNQIQQKPSGNGVDFSMSVKQNDGPVPRNPCKSILDAWKATHPEDFVDNPLMPTIKNYHPSPAS